ncbi:ATP-binding protein [Aeromicrobium sp. YIM 150415]|uniref:ATP-binding protein n=1 Tax=Aeromicrobium sp. YIM 150415 TaxID=2803912 RepID=UPI0019658450|nr:ATP-binding protein [Aeromicrobium sp. YIM 150415]MBM9462023.1 ATP-binding protein [Aeromicrobium sp. YIM 150415]
MPAEQPVIRQVFDAPATPESIELVLDAAQQWWDDLGGDVDMHVRHAFTTALAEVTGNIVAHGRRTAGGPRRFDLRLQAHRDRLVAEFTDHDESAEVDVEHATMPPPESEDGRGLALARAVLDRVEHRYDGANHWLLEHRRLPVPAAPGGGE